MEKRLIQRFYILCYIYNHFKLYIYYYDDILSMSDNIILTDRHNGLVICTIPLVPLYKDMNGYVAIFIKIALSQN